uniref:Uncharacterized protein n=1 Tax=Panagrellus redivivus TaxID=6233 RepID=A0A7E4WDY7_PANRE
MPEDTTDAPIPPKAVIAIVVAIGLILLAIIGGFAYLACRSPAAGSYKSTKSQQEKRKQQYSHRKTQPIGIANKDVYSTLEIRKPTTTKSTDSSDDAKKCLAISPKVPSRTGSRSPVTVNVVVTSIVPVSIVPSTSVDNTVPKTQLAESRQNPFAEAEPSKRDRSNFMKTSEFCV